MISLFTYSISGTPWIVVITDSSGHYYYNKESKSSVWQLSETNISDFPSRVDFNELAILVGKANGLRIEEEELKGEFSNKRQRISDSIHISSSLKIPDVQKEDKAVHAIDDDSESVTESIAEDVTDKDARNSSTQLDVLDSSHTIPMAVVQENDTLNLGYSSSDSDTSDEESSVVNKTENGLDTESEYDSDTIDVNEGLNLSLSDDEMDPLSEHEDDELSENFISLLDELSSEISLYDPWFVVEEEILPKVISRPEYYGLNENQREDIFNKWAMDKQNKLQECESSHNGTSISKDDSGNNSTLSLKTDLRQQLKFPSKTQLFYQFLQNFKAEVKKIYYPEFYSNHQKEVDDLINKLSISRPDELYRKLRVTLTDFAKYEKETKKAQSKKQCITENAESGNINLKTVHVRSFLKDANINIGGKCLAPDMSHSAFDQWVQICNSYQIPDQVADNATNFILGDEKRLQCYKEYLNLT